MDTVTIRVTWTTEQTFEVPSCFEVKEGVEFDELPQGWRDLLMPDEGAEIIDMDVD